MSQEPIRICGFRKVGGIYIIGPQPGEGCDRLPYPIHNCPVCKSGIKFSRGFTWIDFNHYAHNHSSITDFEQNNCIDTIECPVCMPSQFPQPYGLLFVGREYTVQTFMDEARRLGISKRIPAKPRNLKPGSIVMLVHNDAALGLKNTNPYVLADEEIEDDVKQPVSHPGIFNAAIRPADRSCSRRKACSTASVMLRRWHSSAPSSACLPMGSRCSTYNF